MGCCGKSSVSAEEADDPKIFFFKKRGCTDCFCLILFIAFWAGLGWITYLSLTVGDPAALLYGKDYLGNRCGVGAMSDKPAVYYPRLDQDLAAQAAIATTMPWKLSFYGLCMESCPNVTTPETCFDYPENCRVYDYGTPAEYNAAGGKASYYATLPSLNLINRCVPNSESTLTQEPDRCAFPQCDGATYAPCDTEYPKTWVLSFPASLNCEVFFKVGEIKQLKPAALSPLSQALSTNVASAVRIMTSIYDSRNEILLLGIACPIVLGFVWLVLLRLFAGIFTYVMIIAIGCAMVLLSLYLWVRAGVVTDLLNAFTNSTLAAEANLTASQQAALNNSLAVALGAVDTVTDGLAAVAPSELTDAFATANSEVPALWFILAVVVSVLTLIYAISMCAARKKIKTAINLVKASADVIKDRPQTMFFPFNTLVLQVLICAFFVLLALCVQTAGLSADHFQGLTTAVKAGSTFLEEIASYNASISGGVDAMKSDADSAFYVQIIIYLYILFGFLWTIESFNNISWTAMSGSISHWYFFRDDDEVRTRVPILRSLWRVLRFHLGSVFFGAFVIALIQLVRIVLMALDKYTKKQQEGNLALKLLIKCTQCCLWCFEKTIKFITNYCYIYVALQGSGFCKSCFLTFSLMVNNLAQLSINTFVRTILSWIQLISLPVGCGWLCNVVLSQKEGVKETIAPTVVTAITAYIIAKTFSLVFSCVLDTLFVCCCRDKADYKGKYMPNLLKAGFGFEKKKKKKGDDEPAAEEAAE